MFIRVSFRIGFVLSIKAETVRDEVIYCNGMYTNDTSIMRTHCVCLAVGFSFCAGGMENQAKTS